MSGRNSAMPPKVSIWKPWQTMSRTTVVVQSRFRGSGEGAGVVTWGFRRYRLRAAAGIVRCKYSSRLTWVKAIFRKMGIIPIRRLGDRGAEYRAVFPVEEQVPHETSCRSGV